MELSREKIFRMWRWARPHDIVSELKIFRTYSSDSEHIDDYELRLSERLTRACRLRFARTNCQRAILVHLSQNISNMSITKSDRCRYSQRQNQRKRPQEKRTKTKLTEGWRIKNRMGGVLPFILVTKDACEHACALVFLFPRRVVTVVFLEHPRIRSNWQKFEQRTCPAAHTIVLARDRFYCVIYYRNKSRRPFSDRDNDLMTV